MMNNLTQPSSAHTPSHRASKSGRPTIGFLVQASTGPSGFQDIVWKGFIEAAKERDVNAIVLCGGWIGNVPDYPYNAGDNLVHGIISPGRLDGLAVDWSIGSYISPAEFVAFCNRLSPLPIVSIFGKIEGHTRIRANNKSGLRDLILHLVKDHRYERIAFIKGWEGHSDAEDRYAVYVDTLKECGIALDPDMVYKGDFLEESGARAVEALLKERKKNIQAIVASNDAMALGAMAGLRLMGKSVPEDIAITGFDDSERAGTCFPPLSTVRQSFADIGKAAIDALLGILDGRDGPDSVDVPVKLVIRESCGCSSSFVAEAGRTGETRPPDRPGIAPERKQAIMTALAENASLRSITTDRDFQAGIVEAFIADAENSRPRALLTALRRIIYDLVQAGLDVLPLVDVVSLLKRHVPALWTDKEKAAAAESRSRRRTS